MAAATISSALRSAKIARGTAMSDAELQCVVVEEPLELQQEPQASAKGAPASRTFAAACKAHLRCFVVSLLLIAVVLALLPVLLLQLIGMLVIERLMPQVLLHVYPTRLGIVHVWFMRFVRWLQLPEEGHSHSIRVDLYASEGADALEAAWEEYLQELRALVAVLYPIGTLVALLPARTSRALVALPLQQRFSHSLVVLVLQRLLLVLQLDPLRFDEFIDRDLHPRAGRPGRGGVQPHDKELLGLPRDLQSDCSEVVRCLAFCRVQRRCGDRGGGHSATAEDDGRLNQRERRGGDRGLPFHFCGWHSGCEGPHHRVRFRNSRD